MKKSLSKEKRKMKTYHIISNPVAGQEKIKKKILTVEKIFSAKGVPYQTHFTECVGDATEITKKLTQAGEQEIIALGGDGTLHEVLNGLYDPAACRLGLIPSGTGNDFAEKIGLSKDPETATKFILENEPKPTNYIQIGDKRCMNVAGLGMDVDVLERCKKGKLRGKIKYLMSLLQSLFKYKGCKIKVTVDGKEEEHDALIGAVCNGSQFGGGIKICPPAKVDDDKLNAVIVECIGGKIKLIKALLQLLKGKIIEYPATKHFLCEKVSIIPQTPCTLQMDGELYKNVTFDVKVGKGLLFYR